MGTTTYDPKCYELAAYFLDDDASTPRDREQLAVAIQRAVEAWIDDRAADRTDAERERS